MLTPTTFLDTRYGDGTTPTSWDDAVATLDTAEIFWITTVRADDSPHVTPLLAVWVDDALFFVTGETEQKARNIAAHPRVALTTGTNVDAHGLDLVVEGNAERFREPEILQRVADRYRTKYDWHYTVQDDTFGGDAGNVALVFRVDPIVAYGFAREPYSQTRWTF